MAKIAPNQASTAPPWQGSIRTLFLTALVASLVVIVLLSSAALPLGIGGLLLAYILYPLKSTLRKRVFGGRTGPAVATVVLLVLALLFSIILVLIPTLLIQSIAFVEDTVAATGQFISQPLEFNGEPVLDENDEPIIIQERLLALSDQVLSEEANAAFNDFLSQTTAQSAISITEQIFNFALGFLGNVVNISVQIFGTLAAFALNTLFMMMLLSYFLSDGENMIENIIEIAPDGFERDLRRLIYEFGQVWNDYLRGQLILGVLIGSLMWLTAFILGLQNPVFLAIFAGFMEFIPNIGPVLAMIPPIIVALISGSANFPEMSVFLLVGIIVVIQIIVQQIEGLVLVPRIMGNSLNLHPVVVVLGVVIGGSLGGIIGIILAAPTIATVRILLQYVYGRLADEPPFRDNSGYQQWLSANAHRLRYEPGYVDPQMAVEAPADNEVGANR